MNELNNLDAEEQLLAAILADENTIVVVNELVAPADFYHERCRAVAEAAWSCLQLDPPRQPTRPVVIDRLQTLGRTVPANYLADLDDRGTGQVVRAATEHARIVRKLADARRTIAFALDLAKQVQESPDDLDNIVTAGTAQLYTTLDGGTERPNDIETILDTTEEDTEEPVPTGLRWLDKLVRGWRRSKIYGISGQYKGRKTTIALYLVMRALMQGKNVSVFSVDDDRETLGWQLVAMYATTILRKRNVPVEQHILNDEFCRLPANRRTPEQHSAIEQARASLRKLKPRLRIYDTKDGVVDYDQIERILRRDVMLHGCDMYMMDFLQDLELAPNSRYRNRSTSSHEAFETIVKRFKIMTTRYKLTALWISQLNDNALQGRAGRSAGTKGGISIPAACNCLIETSKEDDSHIRVHMKLGRKAANGQIVYTVNPPSGLVLNPQALP